MKKLSPLFALLLCSGCTSVDYYVKNDSEIGLLSSPVIIHSQTGTSADTLILKTQFFSNDTLEPDASKDIYNKVSNYIQKKNLWQVTDKNPNHKGTSIEFLGITIKDHYDLKAKPAYFLSGLSLGLYGHEEVTDNYDISVVYIDKYGLTHKYQTNAHLITASSNAVLGNVNSEVKELPKYNVSEDAFNKLLAASLQGTRKGTIEVGPIQQQSPQMAPASYQTKP